MRKRKNSYTSQELIMLLNLLYKISEKKLAYSVIYVLCFSVYTLKCKALM